jgi:biopolymer transport protein ExbB
VAVSAVPDVRECLGPFVRVIATASRALATSRTNRADKLAFTILAVAIPSTCQEVRTRPSIAFRSEVGGRGIEMIKRCTRAATAVITSLVMQPVVFAEEPAAQAIRPPTPGIDIRQMFVDGGAIGYIIVALSLVMLALVFEHLLTIRRQTLMPKDLADDIRKLVGQGQIKLAEERSIASSSFLGYLLAAGIKEIELGYSAVEKAMEDAAAQQAARLMRKIEYLSMISTIAPMLGLMGTVWGMILAFMEFERKANPQVSELAPGIYKALVTTLFGLIVAIPAIAAFGFFRNRIDELVAQTALTAEQVFADFKRSLALKRREERRHPLTVEVQSLPVAPVVRRETRG